MLLLLPSHVRQPMTALRPLMATMPPTVPRLTLEMTPGPRLVVVLKKETVSRSVTVRRPLILPDITKNEDRTKTSNGS